MECELSVGHAKGGIGRGVGWREVDNVRLEEVGRALRGHSKAVSMVRSYSGGKFLSGSDDGGVGLWDVDVGVCVGVVGAHSGPVMDVKVMEGGGVVSCGDDGLVKLWDVRSGICVRELKGHRDAVNQIAVMGDDKIASAGVDGALRVWSISKKESITGFELTTGPVWSVAGVSQSHFAAGSLDGSVRLVDVTMCKSSVVHGHHSSVYHIEPMDENTFASGSADGNVKLWNTKTHRLRKVLRGHTGSIEFLNYLGDDLLISGSFDKTARLWNLSSTSEFLSADKSSIVLRGHRGFVRCCASFRNQIATSANDGSIRLWKRNGAHQLTLQGKYPIEALATVHDVLIAGALDGTIHTWRPSASFTV